MDSGCSRHMTRNQSKFVSLSKKDGGLVTLGDNSKIIGKGAIGNDSSILFENVVLVDDFSRFIWVLMIKHKNDLLKRFASFVKWVQNEKDFLITKIRSDHGGEFDSIAFEIFCEDNGFCHDFSSGRTLQQNGVVERKNRTL